MRICWEENLRVTGPRDVVTGRIPPAVPFNAPPFPPASMNSLNLMARKELSKRYRVSLAIFSEFDAPKICTDREGRCHWRAIRGRFCRSSALFTMIKDIRGLELCSNLPRVCLTSSCLPEGKSLSRSWLMEVSQSILRFLIQEWSDGPGLPGRAGVVTAQPQDSRIRNPFVHTVPQHTLP